MLTRLLKLVGGGGVALARLLAVLSVSMFLAFGPEGLSHPATAQTNSAPDPRDAALQVSDLPAGFTLVDEEVAGDGSLPAYAATWLQRDTAELSKDGLLIVSSEDLTSVGGAE